MSFSGRQSCVSSVTQYLHSTTMICTVVTGLLHRRISVAPNLRKQSRQTRARKVNNTRGRQTTEPRRLRQEATPFTKEKKLEETRRPSGILGSTYAPGEAPEGPPEAHRRPPQARRTREKPSLGRRTRAKPFRILPA